MRSEKVSLPILTQMLRRAELQEGLTYIFKSRYLFREILHSSARLPTKKTYHRYVKVLEEGFANQQLRYLN